MLGNTPWRTAVSLSIAVVLFAAVDAGGSLAQQVEGAATVIDGDTLEIRGERYHLRGIDAPELGQQCDWPDKTIDCGDIARLALMDLVAGVRIVCLPAGRPDRGDGRTALCAADGFDLSANMVHTGWALADPETGGEYADTELRARRARRGVWKGEFTTPWDWRARQ